jgi:hypothetical protein
MLDCKLQLHTDFTRINSDMVSNTEEDCTSSVSTLDKDSQLHPEQYSVVPDCKGNVWECSPCCTEGDAQESSSSAEFDMSNPDLGSDFELANGIQVHIASRCS